MGRDRLYSDLRASVVVVSPLASPASLERVAFYYIVRHIPKDLARIKRYCDIKPQIQLTVIRKRTSREQGTHEQGAVNCQLNTNLSTVDL
ncbi:hypothetical protein [Chroococcidiopsis sp. SAG 2025]|uniref:hypothetical protein n=1 Tax=Chroococcidiopsis sp. SAG 2025 TaxID=171389 RepID=UPI0029372DB4|nr:hypothetical protein [Chroococcidiopsis sp. SAG 2025]